MLFNSYEFIFLFLPVTLIGYFALGHREAFRNNVDYFVRYGYYPTKPPRPFAFADRRTDTFANLRRTLDTAHAVAEDTSRHPSAQACDLWDFSGYNDITLEPVPAAGDTKTRMQWYREASHFTRAAGNLVLDRILDGSASAALGPKGFGIRLDRDNVEQVLTAAREGRQRWLSRYRDDAAEIAAIATRYPQNRQPAGPDR